MVSDTLSRLPLDPACLSEIDQPIYDWLTQRFGTPPINFCRQLRWRIGWEADVQIDGRWQSVLVRGNRGKDFLGPMTMHQEAAVHDIMERYGVRAPHIHGMIEEPLAIVMERLPGGINSELIEDENERWAVRRQWIEALARLHAIPISEFGKIGLPVPTTSREAALSLYKPCFKIVRDRLRGRPLPVVEFMARWLEQNAPTQRNRFAFITADSGQFVYDESGFTGMIDFEVAYIGDPAAEFAGMRLRDGTEPLGEISRLCDYYESLTGDRISRKIIAYHSAGYSGSSAMLCWPVVFDPEAGRDFVAYLHFCIAQTRWALQGISEAEDISLEPVPDPEHRPVVSYPGAPAHLLSEIAGLGGNKQGLSYEGQRASDLATYLDRCQVYGASVLEADLADAAWLTGGTFDNRAEAELAVDAFVRAAADQESTGRLIRFFNRWLHRQNFLLKGCGSQAYLTEVVLQHIPLRPADAETSF